MTGNMSLMQRIEDNSNLWFLPKAYMQALRKAVREEDRSQLDRIESVALKQINSSIKIAGAAVLLYALAKLGQLAIEPDTMTYTALDISAYAGLALYVYGMHEYSSVNSFVVGPLAMAKAYI